MCGYNLLINKMQNINLGELEVILKKIALEYDIPYVDNEYNNSIRDFGYFIYSAKSTVSELLSCYDSLKLHGVLLDIKSDRELFPELYDDEDDGDEEE